MKKLLAFLLIVVVALLSVTVTASADKTVSIWLRDIISFGQYPQTAKGNDKTPIAWIVLEIQDGKALLISKYGLDCQPYHKSKKKITWEKCTLRAWLNKDFLKKAFTKEEQSAILTTESDNGKEQNTTKDQIFLLSYKEANEYFRATRESYENGGSRIAPTEYAISRGARTDKLDLTGDDRVPAGSWWLRTSGTYLDHVLAVLTDGAVHEAEVQYKSFLIRPAMWVDLNNEVFSEYVHESADTSSQEPFENWFEDGAGSLLPKFRLQSGEEPEIEMFADSEQECDVRISNAGIEDYRAYVTLLKSCGFKIISEHDQSVEAWSPEGYAVYVVYSEATDRFLEVYIYAPNEM